MSVWREVGWVVCRSLIAAVLVAGYCGWIYRNETT